MSKVANSIKNKVIRNVSKKSGNTFLIKLQNLSKSKYMRAVEKPNILIFNTKKNFNF